MANITRFDPFEDLTRFPALRSFDDLFRGFLVRPLIRDLETAPQIKIEVSEDDKSYTVKAEIPGAKKDDIRVSVDGNQVSIEAEVKKEKEEKKGEKVVHSERYYGKQYRSFTLATDIDSARAEAKYDNGVLELKLPKTAPSRGKEVKIQ